MKKSLQILLILLCTFSSSYAQYRTGFSTSNYSGSAGIRYNPANTVGAPLSWDFNIVNAGVFLDNNWATITNNSILTMLQKEILFVPSNFPRTNLSEFAFITLNTRKPRTNFSTDIFVQLPSVMASTYDKGMGFFINNRTNVTINNFDDDFAYFFAANFNALSAINRGLSIENMRINIMNWTEIGGTYGYKVVDGANIQVKVAATGKLLLSPLGTSIQINSLIAPKPDLNEFELESYLETVDVDLKVSGSNPINVGNSAGVGSLFNGIGFGADFGFVVESSSLYKVRGKRSRKKYNWKTGGSVLDLGSVFFMSKTMKQHIEDSDVLSDGVEEGGGNKLLSNIMDPTGMSSMILPTSFAGFFDLNLAGNFYTLARLNLGMPQFSKAMLRAPNSLTIAPRFESKHIDFAFPLTMHDFRHTRIGFNTRLSILTIGSDNLSNILFKNGFVTGADIYVGVRVYRNRRVDKSNFFINKWMRSRKTKVSRKRFKVASPRF